MKPWGFSHAGVGFKVVQECDLSEIALLQNDYTTWSFLARSRIEKANLNASDGRSYFVVFDRVNPFIGLIRLDEYDKMNLSIRIGVDVAMKLRGRGYGRKILEALKKYCFQCLNTHRVWLLVLETNKRARKLCKLQGFAVEGKQRGAIFREGKYLDYIMMSMMEDEYRSLAT